MRSTLPSAVDLIISPTATYSISITKIGTSVLHWLYSEGPIPYPDPNVYRLDLYASSVRTLMYRGIIG
jgi:hypothetical protein